MSGIGEASAVLGLISSIIAIFEAAQEIYEAASDVKGLPRKFRATADQLPLVFHALSLAKQNIKAKDVSTDALQSARPVLQRCKEGATRVKDIFDKSIPAQDASKAERMTKAIGLKMKSKRLKEDMEEIMKNIELLAQNQVFQDAKTLQDIKEAVEQLNVLDGNERPQFVHLGAGAISANTRPGKMTNYSHSGLGSQYVAETQNFCRDQVIKQIDDFSYRGPAGLCLGHAPHIDATLFIGRPSELNKMKELLKPEDKSQEQRRLVLGGIGGIGKTQLAIAYAKHHHKDYTSVFWLNATSETSLKNSFQKIAELIFDMQGPGILEDEQILGKIRGWLSDKQNIQWLLIFDNYDDPNQFKIEEYFPLASHGAIVITTRRPDRVAGKKVRIEPLKQIDESLRILATRSERQDTETDRYAKLLAGRLGGLPLALATAGAYLCQSPITFERYLQKYEQQWDIDPRRPIQLQEYQDRTLHTTWNLSYDRLRNDDPDAAKLLKLLAYFGNQSIWCELLRSGLGKDSPDWMHELMTDDINLIGAMRTLTDYCFLESQTTQKTWSMHACVHDWTLAVLNKDLDAQQHWYAFDCVAASIDEDDWDSLDRLSYSRLAAHGARLVHDRFCQNDLVDNMEADRINKSIQIGEPSRQQVQLEEAERMCVRAVARSEKALGSDHVSTLDAMNNLGVLYYNQRKIEKAEQMYNRALAGSETTLRPGHILTRHIINNLGMLYNDQGKLEEAEQMYNRALAWEKTLRPDHTSIPQVINNLGVLYRAQGKLEKAEEMYTRALAGTDKALGPDHTSTLYILNNLGNLYLAQGKLEKAEEMHMRALAGYEKALGPDHASTLKSVNNLGSVYRVYGELPKLIKLVSIWEVGVSV